MTGNPTDNGGDIAVVGAACQVPGADNLYSFRDNLAAARQFIADVPDARLPGYTAPAPLRASLLENPADFDARFFAISPRMANWMDPQQRLLLETTWRALEDAAIDPRTTAGAQAGVYVSTTSNDFRDQARDAAAVEPYSALGLLPAYHANRISYQYDWRGPSITLDNACAAGLTTVGLAVSGLRSGEIDLGVACGVNVLGHGYMQSVMLKFGAVSPSGTPRCFDADANGYVRGDGVFCFILKRLADAIADQDPIHGVIKGCVLSHDGRSGGLTRTDRDSQVRLIRRSLAQAGATPTELGYVEAHAAGTLIGDATEVAALVDLLGTHTAAGPAGRLWVGSVKANIGHLEGAAGAASLMKALLILRFGQIPPTPGFRIPNPGMPIAGTAVGIADHLLPWPAPTGDQPARLLGVNSFGVGGSSGHLTLADPPHPNPRTPAPPHTDQHWIPMSAADPQALQCLAADLADHVQDLPTSAMPAVVHTLQAGRAHLQHRRLVHATDPTSLAHALRESDSNGPPPPPALADWLAGRQDQWPAEHAAPAVRRVPLTPYPFQRRTHWFTSPPPPTIDYAGTP
ncbi:polyketide synthase [Micromonospora sp. CB01531]|uniref:polyketide synthase n=1 Tax=Micromonospora sp. CB01531 TaxID=1718947 RepID=UPI00093BB986|nr:polyketide synthase [Micromonospora sp. CB01531]OKI48961.1 hypothetical protein A6A27_36140 [Micromonospora sp. CB01531]